MGPGDVAIWCIGIGHVLQRSGMTVRRLHDWTCAYDHLNTPPQCDDHVDYKQQSLRQIKHILLGEISLATMLMQEDHLLCTLPGKASPILRK